MPTQTTRTTRDIDGYHVVIEQNQQMALPMGSGLNWITPAIHISVYRPEADTSAESGTEPQPVTCVLRHVFRFPAQKMSKVARKTWSDACVQRLLTLLATPASRAADQPDILSAGVYSAGGAPNLYLIETLRPRDGYTEALAFDARRGSAVRRMLIDVATLVPVRDLIAQGWQHELRTYRPADGSRRTIDHVTGCLLGGAIGDALGAGLAKRSLAQIRAQFGSTGADDYVPIAGNTGTLSWHSQMSLFTTEGLIRAKRRGDAKGICDIVGVVLHAYYRWLTTQGEVVPKPAAVPTEADGWLVALPLLHTHRGPSPTVLTALRSGQRGTFAQPINHSKGAGALARIASVGLVGMGDPFVLGTEIAALTHGHSTGYLAAGYFASLINQIISGASLVTALDASTTKLRRSPGHEACLSALDRAQELATHAPAVPASVEQLGHGASAEEALAIAVFCALKADDFAHGVRLAINHSGASDLTGALTGQLLGALLGKQRIPERWQAPLELRHEIEQLASDLFLEFSGFPHASWFTAEWDTYPGW